MTEIYGQSDDLIEFDGDVRGEVGFYQRDDDDSPGCLIICSDGTLLEVKYGKGSLAIWGITVIKQGELFSSHEVCHDEEAKRYSDTVKMKDGLKWAYAAREWERVK